MVEKRARDLAVINGRPAKQFNQLDIDQAKKELQGQTGPAVPEASDPAIERLEQWDEAPGSSGVKIPNQTPDDEQPAAEALVEEGVEEAEHDRMLAAAKGRKGGGRTR